MANKDYSEDGEGSGLPQRVRGSKGSPADFREYKNPDGTGDETRDDLNKSGVALPQDSPKHLPKAGGKVE